MANPFVAAVIEDLRARYAEPWRHYHTLHHIENCLAEFAPIADRCHDPVAVETAIWFHDAIYDPHADDNEARSAQLAAGMLASMQGAPEFIDRVVHLIMATTHVSPPGPGDPAWICDIDLSSLGVSPQEFDANAAAIRREYAHVPDPAFAAGRLNILRRFLDRPSIYATDYFRSRYEATARHNIERALARLAGYSGV